MTRKVGISKWLNGSRASLKGLLTRFHCLYRTDRPIQSSGATSQPAPARLALCARGLAWAYLLEGFCTSSSSLFLGDSEVLIWMWRGHDDLYAGLRWL